MAGQVSGLAVFYATAGGILLWSGFKGQTISGTVKAITSGNSAALSKQGSETVGTPSVSVGSGSGSPSSSGGGNAAGNLAEQSSSSGGTPAANKVIGQAMAATYGWTGTQWAYLKSGWQEESGWDQHVHNSSSPAYGIAQASGHGNAAAQGTESDSYSADYGLSAAQAKAANSGSAGWQIAWGLGYIKATYGSPEGVPGWSANGPAAGYQGY